MTTQDTGPDELTAHHIPHADSNCADVVLTLVIERIRLQQELADTARDLGQWQARADGWQLAAAQYRADSQRHEDVATELRKHVEARDRQLDRLRAEHKAWHPDAVRAALDRALAIIKAGLAEAGQVVLGTGERPGPHHHQPDLPGLPRRTCARRGRPAFARDLLVAELVAASGSASRCRPTDQRGPDVVRAAPS